MRSLTMNGTPNGASAALIALASSTMARVSLTLSRNWTRVAPPAAKPRQFDEVAAAGVLRIDDGINTQIELFHGHNVGEPREQYHASCAEDVSMARPTPEASSSGLTGRSVTTSCAVPDGAVKPRK